MANDDFDPTRGPDRVILEEDDRATLEHLQAAQLLVVDGRRSRSNYFDGQFLAARNFTRDQNYVLTRQADLSRAGGTGVIAGLLARIDGSRSLRISAGQGITQAGEIVALAADLVIGLDNVAELSALEATSGLRAPDSPPPETRTGLYALVLRPVEYTTRQIVKYPTAVSGRRSLEAGDIAEGVAVTLVPWRDSALDAEPERQRARAAYLLFVEQSSRGIPAEALPLALMRLERGVIRWLDPWLVRREVGAEQGGVVGFGIVPRALREAHLIQYDIELSEIMRERQARGGLSFAAADYFDVLPPAGRMPAAAIDPASFTQFYFPQQMTVELSIVNQDELAVLIEDSLLLPPIDITGKAEDLDFTRIQVLIPVPHRVRRRLTLASLRRKLAAPPTVLSRRLPLQILDQFSPRQVVETASDIVTDADLAGEAAWRAALAGAAEQMLWFVRARSLEQGVHVLFPSSRLPGGGG